MKVLITFTIITALVLGGYYYTWQHALQTHQAIIIDNIEALEASDARLTITYKSVGLHGFPFKRAIKLDDVTLTAQDAVGKPYQLEMDDIIIALRDRNPLRYLISTSEDSVEATMPNGTEFEVVISEYPILSVRTDDAEGSRVFIEYAAGLPREIVLAVEAEDANGGALGERISNFTMQPINVPIWRKIPTRISNAIEIFVLMLDEAYKQPQ